MNTLSFIFCLFIALSYSWGKTGQQIRLTDITALTFVSGEQTEARRTSAIPQLECVAGTARYDTALHPSTVQCKNVGNDGKNVQWKCEANLDNKVKFGKVVVSCEGYSSKDDPYVLVGSCGLRYTLDYEIGANQQKTTPQSTPQRKYYDDTQYAESSWSSTIFNFVFFGLVIAFIYYTLAYFAIRGNNAGYGGSMPTSTGTGYGQGYGGNPYPGYGASSTYTGSYPSTSSGGWWSPFSGPSTSNGGGWWSGLATGGLLASLWNRQTPTTYGTRSGYHTSPSRGWFGGSSQTSPSRSWFGGNTSGGSSNGGSSSSGSSGPSSRSSTGYATSETR